MGGDPDQRLCGNMAALYWTTPVPDAGLFIFPEFENGHCRDRHLPFGGIGQSVYADPGYPMGVLWHAIRIAADLDAQYPGAIPGAVSPLLRLEFSGFDGVLGGLRGLEV